jgi:hypothetical protein
VLEAKLEQLDLSSLEESEPSSKVLLLKLPEVGSWVCKKRPLDLVSEDGQLEDDDESLLLLLLLLLLFEMLGGR